MRRILTSLRLDKIAAVDAPCQEHASADIMKRDFTQAERDAAAKAGDALPDGSFPIKTVEDLHNAISAYGRAKDPSAAKAHIITRAKSLGATTELPENWINKENTMLKELAKALGLPDTATEADVAKAVADRDAALAKLTATNAANEVLAKMSDKEKSHMAKLDDAGKETFLKMSAKDKAAAVAADDNDGDEAVAKALNSGNAFKTPEGVVIAKAKVGDELFSVLKSQNDRLVSQGADLAKAKEDAEVADFAKRAETIGFEPAFGATMRKAYRGGVDAQAEVEKKIAALNKQVEQGGLFKSFGDNRTDPASAEGEFMAKVEEVKKADPKLTDQQAYAKAYTTRGNADIVKRMKEEGASA